MSNQSTEALERALIEAKEAAKRAEEERITPADRRGWRWRRFDRDASAYLDGEWSWGLSWLDGPKVSIEIARTKRVELGWSAQIDGGGGERDGHLWISLPFLFISVAPDNIVSKRLRKWLCWDHLRGTYARECGVRVSLTNDGGFLELRICVDVWATPNEWSRKGNRTWPWKSTGWQWSWDAISALLGSPRREDRREEAGTATVRLPEGDYEATVTRSQSRWRRARSPFAGPWQWYGEVRVEQGVETDPGSWKSGTILSSFHVGDHRPSFRQLASRFATSILKERYRKTGTWKAPYRPAVTDEERAKRAETSQALAARTMDAYQPPYRVVDGEVIEP